MRASAPRPRFSRELSRSCEIAEWRLILLREDELPKAEIAALRRHLRGCVRCRESHRALDALFGVVRDQPIPETDDPFWEQIAEEILVGTRASPACPGPIAGE